MPESYKGIRYRPLPKSPSAILIDEQLSPTMRHNMAVSAQVPLSPRHYNEIHRQDPSMHYNSSKKVSVRTTPAPHEDASQTLTRWKVQNVTRQRPGTTSRIIRKKNYPPVSRPGSSSGVYRRSRSTPNLNVSTATVQLEPKNGLTSAFNERTVYPWAFGSSSSRRPGWIPIPADYDGGHRYANLERLRPNTCAGRRCHSTSTLSCVRIVVQGDRRMSIEGKGLISRGSIQQQERWKSKQSEEAIWQSPVQYNDPKDYFQRRRQSNPQPANWTKCAKCAVSSQSKSVTDGRNPYQIFALHYAENSFHKKPSNGKGLISGGVIPQQERWKSKPSEEAYWPGPGAYSDPKDSLQRARHSRLQTPNWTKCAFSSKTKRNSPSTNNKNRNPYQIVGPNHVENSFYKKSFNVKHSLQNYVKAFKRSNERSGMTQRRFASRNSRIRRRIRCK